MPIRIFMVAALLLVASAGYAADRKFTIGSFTELVVDGDMVVRLDNGKAPSALAQGSREALSALKIDRQGNTVFVRNSGFQAGRSSGAPVTVIITGRDIRRLALTGAGKISANRLDADNSRVELRGAGSIDIGSVNAFRFATVLSGSGSLSIGAGSVVNSDVVIDGSASFRAAGLVLQNLKLAQKGPATTLLTVSTVAEISNEGTGSITIEGSGICMIRKGGSATINCKKVSQ